MVFSSVTFLYLFLPITFISYYLIRNELRNGLLLCASLLFYAWGEPKLVIIMILSIIMNFYFGLSIDYFSLRGNKLKKLILLSAIISNLGILVYFKYTNFLISNINIFLDLFSEKQIEIQNIIMPIGISFYTFQALSYVIDVYKGDTKVQKNIFDLALYIVLFPQLIAGPIVRYHDVAEQITSREHNIEKISYGIRRFIIGLSKKVILANTMGQVSDSIFAIPAEQLPFNLSWLGIIAYAIQIFYDFSGYSDMAIGLGSMFGFKFLENFNYPYISKSITEFWRRWHISLSSWFKDYLYIPLGGNRKGKNRTYLNLFIVFICTGIWHGASWNFLIWGIYHGIFLIFERKKIVKWDNKLSIIFGRLYTLLVVLIGWVFFRSDSLGYAIIFIKSMFTLINNKESVYYASFYLTNKVMITFIIAVIGCTPLAKRLYYKIIDNNLNLYSEFGINVMILIIFFISIMYLSSATYNPFIYFRF